MPILTRQETVNVILTGQVSHAMPTKDHAMKNVMDAMDLVS